MPDLTKPFRCPECGGHYFGGHQDKDTKVWIALCHDQFSKGCTWRGTYQEAGLETNLQWEKEMLTEDTIIKQLVMEANNRVITASAQAIRDAVGNLPLPADSVEIFISAESERLGALLRHDMEMFLLRVKHDGLHPAANPGPRTHDVFKDSYNMYGCRDCLFTTDLQSRAENHAMQPVQKRYEITGPINPDKRYLEAMDKWHGEPRRQDESLGQFRRRVMREVEKG